MYRQGRFAFDNVTDKGAAERAKHTALPKLKKACQEGVHLYSQYVGTLQKLGMDHIVARCPDCGDEVEFAEQASARR